MFRNARKASAKLRELALNLDVLRQAHLATVSARFCAVKELVIPSPREKRKVSGRYSAIRGQS
jgi:hypothetical protein